jgi:hypothetical protein
MRRPIIRTSISCRGEGGVVDRYHLDKVGINLTILIFVSCDDEPAGVSERGRFRILLMQHE